MPCAHVLSAAFVGLDPLPVDIEVDLAAADNSSMTLVGLPDTAVKESKERVWAAIKNSGFPANSYRCTVNLAPGDVRKEGSLYDLPIALGVLCCLKAFPSNHLQEYLIVGELGLGGELRPIHGALALALFAKEKKMRGLMLPASNVEEASQVAGIDIIPILHLKEAATFLRAPKPPALLKTVRSFIPASPKIDFADIKGQSHVKRALEIAAAGEHNVLLSGPPGTGKTMLAKAFSGILPEMSIEESLAVSKIYSLAGLLKAKRVLITERPFRSPHHTISYAGLVGGGSSPRPGEISLAHRGVLFLDELPEFSRHTLEVLRQPLEDRQITVSRSLGSVTFPADFIFIAAMNPCPCGYFGHPEKNCQDSKLQIERYRRKISGPLLDRIDMHVVVPAVKYKEIIEGKKQESSTQIRDRVQAAQVLRKAQKHRMQLNPGCRHLLGEAIDQMALSLRAHDRIIKVAETIAHLEKSSSIREEYIMEALNFRMQDLIACGF